MEDNSQVIIDNNGWFDYEFYTLSKHWENKKKLELIAYMENEQASSEVIDLLRSDLDNS